MNRLRSARTTASALLAVVALCACAPGTPIFVDENAAYSAETIIGVLERTDPGKLVGRPTDDAAGLRREALVALRTKGGTASKAADLLTSTFADLSPGVPYYVERATFEGDQAVVVAEVIGPRGGRLEDVRIWVIADSGDILYSGTR